MSELLSTSDVTWMQDIQGRALPGTIVIESKTLTTDGMGGYSEAWAAVGTVDGRIMQRVARQSGETLGGAQVSSVTQWFATMPSGTTVTAANRLKFESRTYEIISVNNDASWQTATRCEVRALNEELRA